jgi:hypothetical protein
MRISAPTCPHGADELIHERASDDGDLGVGVALQRVERKSDSDARPVAKPRSLVGRDLQFHEALADIRELCPDGGDVALEEGSDPRVDERLTLVGSPKRSTRFRRQRTGKLQRRRRLDLGHDASGSCSWSRIIA